MRLWRHKIHVPYNSGSVCGTDCRSEWPRGLMRRSTATRALGLWVWIPSGAWMSVCCECCVLSGRGLCDGLITRLEESYRLWRVVVCDQETSRMRRLKPATGLWKYNQKGCNARKTNKQTNIWDWFDFVDRTLKLRLFPSYQLNAHSLYSITIYMLH